MSRLKRVMEDNAIASQEKIVIPTYTIDAKKTKKGKSSPFLKNKIGFIAIIVLVICIYVPQFFISENSFNETTGEINYLNHALNSLATLNNPEMDYDNDGLTNKEELELSSYMWDIDTDNDGVSDFYEARVLGTNLSKYENTLLTMQKELDKQAGYEVSDPYKIGNVILWADGYESKAYGSVIETPTGYRFCNFKGYAQFPNYENIYVYEIKDGIRTQVSYKETEQAWKINGTTEIEIYSEPLEEIVEITVFGNTFYPSSNPITRLFAFILPDEGFITAQKMTAMDIEPDTRKAVSTSIQTVVYNLSDYSRLTHNDNNLNDLSFVRNAIKDGSCIAASLYSNENGEAIVIIYGYTYTGDLLVANAETLSPIGTIKIDECAKKMINNSGEIVSYSYFEFSGFGFDSSNGDRISFFAASKTSEEYNSHFNEYQNGLNYDSLDTSNLGTEEDYIDYD